MSKLYITGDCHGDFDRFSTKKFPQLKEMGRDDCMIIAGDFGGIWSGEQTDRHTHCDPTNVTKTLDPSYQPDKLTDFLESVKERCQFSRWFCGHYHLNQVIDKRFVV